MLRLLSVNHTLVQITPQHIGLAPFVATAFGSTVVGNTISYSGDAPLSWFGNALGPLFGLATKKEVKKQYAHMTHISTEVQAHKMGGLNIEKAFNAVNKWVDYYGDHMHESHSDPHHGDGPQTVG